MQGSFSLSEGDLFFLWNKKFAVAWWGDCIHPVTFTHTAMCLYFAVLYGEDRAEWGGGGQLLLSYGESASFGTESRRHTADLLVDIMLAVPSFSAPVWSHCLAGEYSGVYLWDYEVDLSSVLLLNCLKQWVIDKWGVSNNVPTVGWFWRVILNADLRGSVLCVMNVRRAKKRNSSVVVVDKYLVRLCIQWKWSFP